MCKHTYHHYPSCGHISNWSMTSCQEYTNKLRLAGPERSTACTNIHASHDLLLSAQPSMCVQCESDWAESLRRENLPKVSRAYRVIEGLDVSGNLIEIEARMVSGSYGRDTGRADCATQVFLDDAKVDTRERLVDEKEKAGAILKLSRRNPKSEEIAARIVDWTETVSASIIDADVSGCQLVETDLPDVEETSETQSGSCSESSDCGSLCGSALMRYHIIKLRVDEYLRQRELEEEIQRDTDVDKHNSETFGIDECPPAVDDYLDTPKITSIDQTETQNEEPNSPSINQTETQDDEPNSPIDIDLLQQRIEATVRKRIEENNTKQTHQTAISTHLDAALLQKDRISRLERNADQGIEEDPHLWATESDTDPNPTTNTSRTATRNHALPQPIMHLYIGTLTASTAFEAHTRGLRSMHPGPTPGTWEGYMRAFSASDAKRMDLQDPVHVRGCCASRPAPFHLFYGLMHASSEYEAGRRWLEDIRRTGRKGEFYGLLRADDEGQARGMGLSEIRHPWGCCVEGGFVLPERVRHVYRGVMSGSREEVGGRGFCVEEEGHEGEGEGEEGFYRGFVKASSKLEAMQMGLKEVEHADDCDVCVTEVAGELSISVRYYGYMYAKSEEEVVNRGLQGVLLVPGFDIKYSGYVRASSEEEAKAMGLFEPARIGSDDKPDGFLGS
ncbi:uncharacterized protein N7515_009254 [Penicillium bovifimosum]|uniref:Uncharacterized protein n=1 Tax=Penicillium bovifimosum TaxID=126998 RepID=A0A9W9GIX8_9EURO|nr:uncharacterized protein N7515_009254 [Penicillium bovifimosum]KAJ5121293.1 hypothetical protein N7515_009254 [Penicillium bovifimosum]